MNMLFLVLRWLCVTLLRKQVVVSGLTGTEVTWLILVKADNLCGAKNNIRKMLLNSVIWIFCGLAFFSFQLMLFMLSVLLLSFLQSGVFSPKMYLTLVLSLSHVPSNTWKCNTFVFVLGFVFTMPKSFLVFVFQAFFVFPCFCFLFYFFT